MFRFLLPLMITLLLLQCWKCVSCQQQSSSQLQLSWYLNWLKQEANTDMGFLNFTSNQVDLEILQDVEASGFELVPVNPSGNSGLKDPTMMTLVEYKEPLGGRQTSTRQTLRMPKQYIPSAVNAKSDFDIPAQFDARTVWPKCKSLNVIRNQGECSSCWAHAVASALTDRLCIFSDKQSFSATLSAQDLLLCCSTCGTCEKGCAGGGVAEMGYDYFVTHGIVTGGGYREGGCVPYESEPQEFGNYMTRTSRTRVASTKPQPLCPKKCTNRKYPIEYSQDKLKGREWFIITKYNNEKNLMLANTERATKLEIMTNGSVTVTIEIYDDFRKYKSGVYTTDTGKMLGYHVLKCIGWGTDKTTKQPYWLLANSWGQTWGEGGFMRILRGKNIAGVEARVSAGIPVRYNANSKPIDYVPACKPETGTSSASAKLCSGISDAWRQKLYQYENHCGDRIHLGGVGYDKRKQYNG